MRSTPSLPGFKEAISNFRRKASYPKLVDTIKKYYDQICKKFKKFLNFSDINVK